MYCTLDDSTAASHTPPSLGMSDINEERSLKKTHQKLIHSPLTQHEHLVAIVHPG